MTATAHPDPSGLYPIRTAHVISAINTEQAGTEGHLLRLVRKLDKSKYQPRLFVLQRSEWTERYNDPQIPLQVLDFKSFQNPRDWLSISKLARHFVRNQTQVVDLHMVDAHFSGAIAARLAKVPVVISNRRDLGYHYGLKSKCMVRLANPFVSRFIANAQVVADRMSEIERVSRDRFDVIYNGIDLEAFDANATGSVSDDFARFTNRKRVISIAANLRPVKCLNVFLDAAAQVIHADPSFSDCVFVLMGEGNLRGELEAQARQLGIRERVLFAGSVPSTAPYLVRSHIGCLSSRSEGFSNAVVEYMAAGLPSVVTEVGGLPEAITNDQTGYVVPPNHPAEMANAFGKLLRLPEEQLSAMGQQARQHAVDRFSMQRQIEAFDALYSRQVKPTA